MQHSRTTIGGQGAEVRWGYHAAATVAHWSIAVEPTGTTLTASIVSCDAVRVSQHPLRFVVPRPSGHAWAWPITELQIAGETLTASLGPQES